MILIFLLRFVRGIGLGCWWIRLVVRVRLFVMIRFMWWNMREGWRVMLGVSGCFFMRECVLS